MENGPCYTVVFDLFCDLVNKPKQTCVILEGQCAGPSVCPLSRVKAGTVVCIKQLSASDEVRARLREMGLGEQQRIKRLNGHSPVICQVCNARLGISQQLADAILVEALPLQTEAA